MRTQLLLNMWERTRKYLVLTEHGSLGGFQLILEARRLLTKTVEGGLEPGVIVAPVSTADGAGSHAAFFCVAQSPPPFSTAPIASVLEWALARDRTTRFRAPFRAASSTPLRTSVRAMLASPAGSPWRRP